MPTPPKIFHAEAAVRLNMRRRRSLFALPAGVIVLCFSKPTFAETTLSTVISSLSSTSSTTHSGTLTSTKLTITTTVSHLSDLPTLPATTPIPSASASSIPSTIPGSPATNGNYESAPSASEDQHSNLVNLYFFFLLLAGVIAAGAVWLIYRRKRRRAQAMRSSRRDALERDLSSSTAGNGARGGIFGPIDGERWRDRRRWLTGFTSSRFSSQNVEGLDASGEAPPPYKARLEGDGAAQTDTRGRKPPDYDVLARADISTDGSVTEGGSTRRPSAETRMEHT